MQTELVSKPILRSLLISSRRGNTGIKLPKLHYSVIAVAEEHLWFERSVPDSEFLEIIEFCIDILRNSLDVLLLVSTLFFTRCP
ncbi:MULTISPECIES: hypothetical protein [Nostocales]|uniref:Uncharacterized protein n=3 Tax=Nostocales TaxID=1161 RepID=A0A8S9SZA8_9CYAN|nr:hypothetical protein [Tolypothrix bouteillei]KAF3885701.1 hypothetical protein DA73_0400009680 [Tolypothrix bouteillei VB521301]